MPIYEYACPACGHRFEKIQRQRGDQQPCPKCGAAGRPAVSRPAATSANCGSGGFT